MNWTDDAQAAVNKAPFFVRGMIKRRAEEHVKNQGRDTVTLEDVQELKNKAMRDGEVADASVVSLVEQPNDGQNREKEETFYGGMTAGQIEKIVENTRVQVLSSSRFYEVKVCGGAFGCPRSLYDVRAIAERIIDIIEKCGVPEAIEKRVKGPILRHNKPCVSISGCPNSCSQPQIADFGVQGRARPAVGPAECIGCGQCIQVCKEGSVTVPDNQPTFDRSRCIDCGDCAAVCPTGSIITQEQGYSVLVGGKLGRHPQLAQTLFDFADEKTLLASFKTACDIFANELQEDERFAGAVDRIGVGEIRHRTEADEG